MNVDENDIKVLKENFNEETIKEMNIDNVASINKYLLDNGVYYAKDLFLLYLDLFLLPKEEFTKRFEKLKVSLGKDFADKLGENLSLIEIMYED